MTAKKKNISIESFATEGQQRLRERLSDLARTSPIPDRELSRNLALFVPWQEIGRILFMAELYQQILETPGVLMEFGVRWGRNMALYSTLRATLEPFNLSRKIIGFDTFTGLPAPSDKDGATGSLWEGAMAVSPSYKDVLDELLGLHESELPYADFRKYELIEGDASETLIGYLAEHPETVVALAYFNMDLYASTKMCLEAILPHTTKGSVIAFDEINHANAPGETVAVREVLGLPNVRLQRSRLNPLCAYLVVE